MSFFSVYVHLILLCLFVAQTLGAQVILLTLIKWTNLTENVGTDGSWSAVSGYGDFSPTKAFQRQTWSWKSKPAYLGGGLPKTIWYNLRQPTVIGKFSFRNRRERRHKSNNPVNFEFVGSTNCGNWTVIQTFSGVGWSRNDEKKIYKIENTDLMESFNFSCYGIRVTKNSGSRSFAPCIQDIKMWRLTWDDDDECASSEKNNCHLDAECTNTLGSYKCKCKLGYSGNGTSCTDDDECASSETNKCHFDAKCTNTPGSYKCECKLGYSGGGTICTDTGFIVAKAPPSYDAYDPDKQNPWIPILIGGRWTGDWESCWQKATYENGYGQYGIESKYFFMGLNELHKYTLRGSWQVMLEMNYKNASSEAPQSDQIGASSSDKFMEYSIYDNFKVDEKTDKFRAHVGQRIHYNNNSSDLLSSIDGNQFQVGTENQCAERLSGGWWYDKDCWKRDGPAPILMMRRCSSLIGFLDWSQGAREFREFTRAVIYMRRARNATFD